MNKEEVINLMRSSKNSKEWNNNAGIVKKAHNGGYPSFWYDEIIQSGLADQTLGTDSSSIKIKRHNIDDFDAPYNTARRNLDDFDN